MIIQKNNYLTKQNPDILKTTAQFVARNGEKFLLGLTEREQRNPQFDFLKPTHHLFQYFMQLTNLYGQIIMSKKDTKEKLEKIANNREYVMTQAFKRFQYRFMLSCNYVTCILCQIPSFQIFSLKFVDIMLMRIEGIAFCFDIVTI